MDTQHQRREVQISHRSQLEELLDAAERDLRTAATRSRTHGSLATRRRPDLYVLELSDQVHKASRMKESAGRLNRTIRPDTRHDPASGPIAPEWRIVRAFSYEICSSSLSRFP